MYDTKILCRASWRRIGHKIECPACCYCAFTLHRIPSVCAAIQLKENSPVSLSPQGKQEMRREERVHAAHLIDHLYNSFSSTSCTTLPLPTGIWHGISHWPKRSINILKDSEVLPTTTPFYDKNMKNIVSNFEICSQLHRYLCKVC